jgi:hypothetical protein
MYIDPEKHRKLIDFAYDRCMKIERRKKHCSIILHKNKIVAVGINRFKTHPLAVKYGYQFGEVHSELDAFVRCDMRADIELWNFRFNRLGQMRMARPCPKCFPWCVKLFDNIYHTTAEGIVKMEPSFIFRS